MQNPLRNLPSVTDLLKTPVLSSVVDKVSHSTVVSAARRVLDEVRSQVKSAADAMPVPSPQEIADRVAQWVQKQDKPKLKKVINATGIVLHTGLGRAPLSGTALGAIQQIAAGYCSLEIDLESGERSQRVDAVEDLICEVTGAEAAVVVNNNAAATLLVLSALGQGKEFIVSRGQLVEIGGNFRLPDVMSSCGAILREVGTTNKTRVGDYEEAIGPNTAALMRVHTSNYAVVGFTESASLAELVELGKKKSLPVIDDIGSGALVDFKRYGLMHEPFAPESIEQGADLVLFSGDKLVGGPQCGIIAGKKEHIKKIAKHPMMRAMRVDKLVLGALVATLRAYRDVAVAEVEIPLLSILNTPLDNLKHRAERLAPQLAVSGLFQSCEAVEGQARLGGGSLPNEILPTWCIAMVPKQGSVETLSKQLRVGEPAVMGRIHDGKFLLDLKAVAPAEDLQILSAIQNLAKQSS